MTVGRRDGGWPARFGWANPPALETETRRKMFPNKTRRGHFGNILADKDLTLKARR